MESELIGIGGLAGAGIVLAVVEGLKRTFNIVSDRFTFALSIATGIGLNILIKLDTTSTVVDIEETTWIGTALLGILAGLAASGLYSGGKATLKQQAE